MERCPPAFRNSLDKAAPGSRGRMAPKADGPWRTAGSAGKARCDGAENGLPAPVRATVRAPRQGGGRGRAVGRGGAGQAAKTDGLGRGPGNTLTSIPAYSSMGMCLLGFCGFGFRFPKNVLGSQNGPKPLGPTQKKTQILVYRICLKPQTWLAVKHSQTLIVLVSLPSCHQLFIFPVSAFLLFFLVFTALPKLYLTQA